MMVVLLSTNVETELADTGAALIELEDSLRQNAVVTCTREKCLLKRRKRTHNEASNLEEMTFLNLKSAKQRE